MGRQKLADSVRFQKGYYCLTSHFGAMPQVRVIAGPDTMTVQATASTLDSIPFLPGTYRIGKAFNPLFDVTPRPGVAIRNKTWDFFRLRSPAGEARADTLAEVPSRFWKDAQCRVEYEGFRPGFWGFWSDPQITSTLYVWNRNELFASRDHGLNWGVVYDIGPGCEIRCIALKSPQEVVVLVRRWYAPAGSSRDLSTEDLLEARLSRDGGKTWMRDPALSGQHFWYLSFRNRTTGLGFVHRYVNNDLHTVGFATADGGKTWKALGAVRGQLFPDSELKPIYWSPDTLAVASMGLFSLDRGTSWRKLPPGRHAYPRAQFYPFVAEPGPREDVHALCSQRAGSTMVDTLLTFRNALYYAMAFTPRTWCLNFNRATLVTQDNGKTWRYFYGNTGGSIFYVNIADKYLFTGASRITLP
ncbi:hypothetical protein GCM10027345_45020 [Hymenobacter daeguensis]